MAKKILNEEELKKVTGGRENVTADLKVSAVAPVLPADNLDDKNKGGAVYNTGHDK